ncbi:hypothetical protein Y032_0006g2994 [Ancylostoma ceylanicum]|uniref:Oxidoreductase, short chain dehydrogenase/reductase family protein n=1 Tax=Ancylostoma ceylanicum TaxID=53326 RepID=A0A016VQ81_9BILA|nr:hypothetical protein Y032_0006g2994 [Ancylostoma ceylanicum]
MLWKLFCVCRSLITALFSVDMLFAKIDFDISLGVPHISCAGASSGIGQSVSVRLAREGYALSLSGRDEKALMETVEQCKEAGADKVIITVGDLCVDSNAQRLVDNTMKEYQRIDTLVNSAGILVSGNVLDAGLDLYDRQMDVNVKRYLNFRNTSRCLNFGVQVRKGGKFHQRSAQRKVPYERAPVERVATMSQPARTVLRRVSKSCNQRHGKSSITNGVDPSMIYLHSMLKNCNFFHPFMISFCSVVRLTRMALPYIIKTKGTVVSVSSITGPCPFPGVTYYCMSKAALDQFTKCLALEMAPHGVRVNAVNPGVIVTNVHKRAGMDDQSYSEFLEKGKSTHALGRVGEASEVAEAVFFLASEKSSFTTGELLRVDGGRGIMHPR